MASDEQNVVYIGWDSREAVAADVCAHSIRQRTKLDIDIRYLKHRDLRRTGFFSRPWLIEPERGNFQDLIDGRPFSTEFSHTRFLIPALQNYRGWALFMDSDMIFLSDIRHLFGLADSKYAVMCVKHTHNPRSTDTKMDGREQLRYYRKNWSSFMLFNCAHPANRALTKERVNFMKGGDLHALSWLADEEIGSLPFRYNYISGVSQPLPQQQGAKPELPYVIHYTEGGPWFKECADVPYGRLWMDEFEDWQRHGDHSMSDSMPSVKYDLSDRTRNR